MSMEFKLSSCSVPRAMKMITKNLCTVQTAQSLSLNSRKHELFYQDGDDRNVIIIFNNPKGYDGMFRLQHCYSHHREITDQIVESKILSFKSDRLTFIDSLRFLSFSLSSFLATFGLTELCKGFFCQLFNTVENQDYEGPWQLM